jgi:hypothetical protein
MFNYLTEPKNGLKTAKKKRYIFFGRLFVFSVRAFQFYLFDRNFSVSSRVICPTEIRFLFVILWAVVNVFWNFEQ